MKTFTREELEVMPIELLRGRDIQTKEEEDLVQEVLNERMLTEAPAFEPDIPFRQGTTTDIKTKEEEDALQATIDAQKAEHMKRYVSQETVKFCEFCDSRGVIHKNVCTRPK